MNDISAKMFACILAVVAAVGACFAEGTAEATVVKGFDDATGVYAINVAEGSSYKITADDIKEAGAYPIAKRGSGTLEVGGTMGSFAGEIRIEEGVYKATKAESLGALDGGSVTVVSNGATLMIACATENAAQFKDKILLAGTISNSSDKNHLYAFQGQVELIEDAEIRGQSLGIKNSNLKMNGCRLTLKMNASAVMKFENVELTSPGDIAVEKGRLHLEGEAKWEGDENNKLDIASGAILGMREAQCDIAWSLNLAHNAILYPSMGDIDSFEGNTWEGPVVLNGTAKVEYKNETPNTYMRFDGQVSGEGKFAIGQGAWLVLSNPLNTFTGGVVVARGDAPQGGLVLAANGALPPDGGKLEIKSGTVRLSSAAWYDLPFVEVTSGGKLTSDHWGYGGTIAKMTKWGVNIFDFHSPLSVTGEVHVSKATMRISSSPIGTVGLMAVHTNFANQVEWENFIGGVPSGSTPSDKQLVGAFANLFRIAEADDTVEIVDSPVAAYRAWSDDEKYLMGAYSGYIWNNSSEECAVTFASSIADTAMLWINGVKVLKGVASKRDNDNKTHFVYTGECVLKPGANLFQFLLGHRKSVSWGPRSDMREESLVYWEEARGLMYRNGSYGTPAVLDSRDFVQLIDPGDGMLFTTSKNPSAYRTGLSPDRYRPNIDQIRFDRKPANERAIIDFGGIGEFPINSLTGCPRITNGTMCVTGTWSFVANDIEMHPVEVAAGGGIVFDNAVLDISVAAYPRGDAGTVILRADAGAAVTGIPAVAAADPGIAVWEVKRENRDGDLCLVLYGRLRGTVISFR